MLKHHTSNIDRQRKQIVNRPRIRGRVGKAGLAVASVTKPADNARKIIRIAIASIIVPKGFREIDWSEVFALAQSIEENGLQMPIEVRWAKSKVTGKFHWRLVSGQHRIEATKILQKKYIDAFVVECSKDEARQRTIAENLHRSKLTVLEKAEHIVEWARLTQGAQFEHLGDTQIAEALGLSRADVWRARKIAAINPEAKAAAKEALLDDSQTALLAIAEGTTPQAQLAKVRELENKEPKKRIGIGKKRTQEPEGSEKREPADEGTEDLKERGSGKQGSAQKRTIGIPGTGGGNGSRKGKRGSANRATGIGGSKTPAPRKHGAPGRGKSTYAKMVALWKGSPQQACFNGLSEPDRHKFFQVEMLGGSSDTAGND